MKISTNILNYSHDRGAFYQKTSDEIISLVNDFTDQEKISQIYKYFENKYQLPEDVVKQKIRQQISQSYLFKSAKFNSKLRLRSIPLSLLKYSALIYAIFFSNLNGKVKKYKLLIDDIRQYDDLKRFEKLLNILGKDNVLCIIKNKSLKKDFPNYNFFNQRLFRAIKLNILIKSIFNEFFLGIWVVLKISLRTRVNLFPATLQIVHSYLSFKSLFESYNSEYIIQERHYETDPIKNFLFKKSGGKSSCSIQKNIIQSDPIFFYMDIDILFSLGTDGNNRAIDLNGRISSIEPVGSLFMEYYWFGQETKKQKILDKEKKYDVAIIGINTSNAYERMDSFNEFMSDYYSIYRWASKLSVEKPEYNIVLIHHSSAGKDFIEEDILLNSNIKVLDKHQNSYEIAFSSKCAVTYGSTMGYELNAHNLPTFFVDPGYRCSILPERGHKYIDTMRIDSYENFYKSINEVIDDRKIYNNDNSNMWCLESSSVSNRISSKFL